MSDYADKLRGIVDGFDYELCEECHQDLDKHVIAPDVLGNPPCILPETREGLTMTPFHTEQIETPAGEYTVEFYSDDDAEQPYDEGFVLAVDGWYTDRIDIEHGDVPREVWNVLRTSGKHRQDSWEYEQRSGAALVRYLTLRGHKGVTLVDSDYRPVEASSDRFEHIHGVAWAPDDATDPIQYVKGQLKEWRAWAEGDTFGWVVKAPGGDVVASVWGYYGWEWYGEPYEYVMGEARDAAEHDANQRVEQASRVGAGIVGFSVSHEFRPYVDHPDLCVAELPDTGDTCNRTREDHGMFELVDTTNELLSLEFATLAAALSKTRTAEWSGNPWKIYDPQGYIVRTWGDD